MKKGNRVRYIGFDEYEHRKLGMNVGSIYKIAEVRHGGGLHIEGVMNPGFPNDHWFFGRDQFEPVNEFQEKVREINNGRAKTR